MLVDEPKHTGIAPEVLGTALLSSAGQKPKPRAQREVIGDQHLFHCFLCETPPQKGMTLRNSGTFLLPFGLVQTGHNQAFLAS